MIAHQMAEVRFRRSVRTGFTLMELLIVIVIIAVLAALGFQLGNRALRAANGAKDVSTMRSVFTTIPIYASDHNDYLPGPLYTNVKAEYKTSSPGRLCNYIAPYLGYENPKDYDIFDAMLYSWQKTEFTKRQPCAYMRKDVPLTPESEETIRPFGHLPSGGEPKTLSHVMSAIDPGRTWAISDLDQEHPDVGTPAWKKYIPETMSHGTYRIAIYWDGHSGKLDKDNNPK